MYRCAVATALLSFIGCVPADSAPPKADAGLQHERSQFVKKLQAQGLIEKIEVAGELPHAWVTPKFLALSHTQKKQFAEVLFAWHYEIAREARPPFPITWDLVLLDVGSGKQVGRYHPEHGLRMD